MNDRFVVSCSQGALGASYYYSGFTHFWTSTDGINWVFSRSKWNNSSNLQNTGNAFHCITDAVQGPVSGQYFAIIWGYGVENNALLYNYGVIAKFSTYFYGGFPGQIMTRTTGLPGMITSTWFNMGAGSFYFAAPGAFGRAEGIRTFNRQINSTSSTIGQYNRGPGTPEGWCMGGRSFGNSYSFGLDMFRTAVINNYGCGADASGVNYPVPPAGQGMVIVRWWQ
jgi:hypothetical protein